MWPQPAVHLVLRGQLADRGDGRRQHRERRVQQVREASQGSRGGRGGAVVGAASVVGDRAAASSLQQHVGGQKGREGPGGGHSGPETAADWPSVEQVASEGQHGAHRSQGGAEESEAAGAAQPVVHAPGVVAAVGRARTWLGVEKPGQRGWLAQMLQSHQHRAETGEQECLQQLATPRRPDAPAHWILDSLKLNAEFLLTV